CFLTVNGEKMSKSLGNFITVKDLLDKGVQGEVIRLALLMTKYNEPLDWNEKLLSDAKLTLDKWYRIGIGALPKLASQEATDAFMDALGDDLNTPKAIGLIQEMPSAEKVYMAKFL